MSRTDSFGINWKPCSMLLVECLREQHGRRDLGVDVILDEVVCNLLLRTWRVSQLSKRKGRGSYAILSLSNHAPSTPESSSLASPFVIRIRGEGKGEHDE
eukprot:745729-Hanusia_phi.AAC.4